MTKRLSLLVLLAVICCAHAAWADETDKRYVQARQLLYLNRFDQALQLVESVMPQTPEQWNKREYLLRDIYRGQKNYAALESLVREAITRNPARADLADWHFLHAEMYLKADYADSARTILDSIWMANPADSIVTRVAMLYENHTLGDWARSTYTKAREFSGDSTKFAYELALLHEARRDYESATTEYFHAMERDSISAQAVQNRVIQLLRVNEGADEIEAALTAAAARPRTAIRANELLMLLRLETGRPDEAAEAAWFVDSAGQKKGITILTFMRQASERGYYDVAARIGEHAVMAYPDSPLRYQVEWEHTVMTERAGDFAAAAEQYRQIATTSPAVRFRMNAALAYGNILRMHLKQPERADSAYARLLREARGGEFHGRAMLGRVMCAEMLGNFDSARAILVKLAASNPRGVVREEMTYRLAELLYFDGNFDAAMDAFNSIVSDFPKSVWVNDALRRSLFLTMYRSAAESDVVALAQAEALSRRGEHDSALARIELLRISPETPLAAMAVLWAADIHLAAGHTDSALALWDEFVVNFPEHTDAPYALKRAADLCDQELGSPELALTRFRKLLESYPRSHFVELARRRIRALGEL